MLKDSFFSLFKRPFDYVELTLKFTLFRRNA
jgi:hypothetical protein